MDNSSNSSRPKKIKLSIFGGIVLLLVIGFAIPLLMSDGTEKFGSKDKEAAVASLKQMQSNYTGNDKIQLLGVLKSSVSSVNPQSSPEAGLFANCQNLYEVLISHKTLFGIVIKEHNETICIK